MLQLRVIKPSVLWLLDLGAAAEFGRDAGELVSTDHDHPQGRYVGETDREVRQVVLVDEEGFQLLQPAGTRTETRCNLITGGGDVTSYLSMS